MASSLSGLKAATVYHFRLVASNSLGTTFGADQAFSTSVPPVVRSGPVRDVTASSATATGTVDPKGRSTSWWIEYGTSTSYGSRTSSRSAGSGFGDRSVSASLSRLVAGTTYHYRVVAMNDVGRTDGTDVAFTTPGVTLAPASNEVVYGRSVRLSGSVPTRQPGEQVTLYAQRLGELSYRLIATLLTGANGAWALAVKPVVATSYKAAWNGGMTAATAIGVRPAMAFRVLGRARFATRATGGRSFAFRVVQLQRRTELGRWVTVTRVGLSRRSAATFRAVLLRGAWRYRIAMSINQAGSGYLAGISRTRLLRR